MMKRLGEPVVLVDNQLAKNCSWYDLLVFLDNDDTDQLMYVDGTFVCTDFAERLHNNAEQAGIRAAYVTIDYSDLEEGHALNAFETTDMGLVFVDCTGSIKKGQTTKKQTTNLDLEELEELYFLDYIDYTGSTEKQINWDKIAYVKEGEKYGVISRDYAKEADYDFYLKIKNNTRYAFFEEGGTVKKVNIYWDM
ncbi:hypothetical protein FKV42_00040 [Methanolobus vulcani]|uniref:Uncharacterized protein n=1 Tax=Methanolobus vulcani TaxID=38026 RepID=A0A7Z8KR72_9EURY|nr:hypothetical protein FKV42_00040 [Methanolobus vulcani]